MDFNENQNRDFKGVWIPKQIWLDERLSPLDKIILAEIDSLCSEEQGCYASNEYIAEFCQCSKTKVSNAISKLIQLGYLYVESFDGRQRVLQSSLTKNVTLTKTANEHYKKCKAGSQKVQDINIIENTNRLLKERKKEKTPQRENQDIENLPLESTSKSKSSIDKTKNAKSENKSFDAMIDGYTKNAKLRAELKEHLRTRKTKKATLTNRAIELSLRRLDELGKTDEEKIKIVQTAIMNGWTAFYPLKEDTWQKRKNQAIDDLETSYDLDAYERSFMFDV